MKNKEIDMNLKVYKVHHRRHKYSIYSSRSDYVHHVQCTTGIHKVLPRAALFRIRKKLVKNFLYKEKKKKIKKIKKKTPASGFFVSKVIFF